MLKNVHVTLVAPRSPGNIGAAARIVKNFELGHLRLIEPCDPTAEEAHHLAVGAADVLERARRFARLEDAVADSRFVVGTTSSRGRRPKAPLDPPERLAPEICGRAAVGPVCLVFGPERGGLTERQLALCTRLLEIPASPSFPTLNLAQAVAVTAYAVYRAAVPATGKPHPEPPAEQAQLEGLFRQMEEVLIHIGFLSRSNPGHIMRVLRRLLQRAEPSEREVRVLRGIFSQIEWFRREGHRLPPEKVEKR
ncbi:MAG: RNA methyltransferase [Acidobacteriota bacterium]